MLAAFYRRAALELVGGLSTSLGRAQADVDVALALLKAGFSVALEPQSCVLATARAASDQSPFRRALCEERLFWRNLGSSGRVGAIAAHAGLVAVEALAGIPRPRLISQLAGRALACCEIGGYVRRRTLLAQLGGRAMKSRPANEQLRVDRSHKAPLVPGAATPQVRSR